MDKKLGKKLAEDLYNKEINGYKINKFIGNGKSAFICGCSKDNRNYAIKIYDKELTEKFGRENVLERINRQTTI